LAALYPSYSVAHGHLAQAIRAAFPDKPWLHRILAVTALASAVADMTVQLHSRRVRPPSEADLHRDLAEFYRQEAERLRAQSPSVVVHVHTSASPQASSSASAYLREEGAPIDTDCYSCATGHLAALEGALRRAQHQIERTGTCDDECLRWVTLAAQEPSALLARDWSDERISRLPQDQQDLIRQYRARVESVRDRLVGPEASAVVDASALLTETTRFTGAGDPIDHPEVSWRLQQAEAALAAAERVTVQWDKDTAQSIRRLRQDLGSSIASHEDVQRAAEASNRISRRVLASRARNAKVEDLAKLADEVHELRTSFRQARMKHANVSAVAMLAPSPRSPSTGHHIPRHVVDRYASPTEETVADVTDRQRLADAYDHLERAIEGRGTKVRYRPLPTLPEGTLLGVYDPSTDTILLDDFARIRDSFALQVLAHETAHALVDGPRCRNSRYVPDTPYEEQPAEIRAQVATLAAMLELGLPVELADGTELPPGRRFVDWERVRQDLGPDSAEDCRWAAEWIVRAARGEDGTLLTETCPLRRGAS